MPKSFAAKPTWQSIVSSDQLSLCCCAFLETPELSETHTHTLSNNIYVLRLESVFIDKSGAALLQLQALSRIIANCVLNLHICQKLKSDRIFSPLKVPSIL